MQIKLSAITKEIGIHQSTLSQFLAGTSRTEFVARKIGEYAGMAWQHLQNMRSKDVEAVVVQAYLENQYPWLKDTKRQDFDYEKVRRECA